MKIDVFHLQQFGSLLAEKRIVFIFEKEKKYSFQRSPSIYKIQSN
jgi:hypothetical protein